MKQAMMTADGLKPEASVSKTVRYIADLSAEMEKLAADEGLDELAQCLRAATQAAERALTSG